MESDAPEKAGVLCDNDIMVAGIDIGDTAAAGRYVIQPSVVERFEVSQQSAGPGHLLRIDQLLAAAKLAGSDEVLHIRDHHRDNRKRLGYARNLCRHPDLHDLCFDLTEACLQASAPGAIGYQDPGR